MGCYCIVKSCQNSTYKSKKKSCKERVTWHRLPTDKELQQKWSQALGVKDIPKSSRICSKHFKPDSFQQFGFGNVRLKPNAVPILRTTPSGVSQDTTAEDNSVPGDTDAFKPSDTRFKDDPTASPHLFVKCEEVQENSQDAANGRMNVSTQTPTKVTANTIRYPGDITEEKLLKMSPQTMVKSMLMLQKACYDKNLRMNRLLRKQRSQLKKIEKLQKLLNDSRKSNARGSLDTAGV